MTGTVGFIGLGNMGGPMALNLVKAGFELVVHDINPARVAPLVAAGGVFPGVSIGDRAGAVRRGSAQPTVHKFTAPPCHGVRRPVPSLPPR